MTKFNQDHNYDFRISIDSDRQIRAPLPRGLTHNSMSMDFGSVTDEVMACQNSAALFDYSFLLRILIKGPAAVQGVSELCGRDFSDMHVGGIRYALLTDCDGWLVSDLTIWRSKLDQLEMMTGRAEDLTSIKKSLAGYDLQIIDVSRETAVLALQGPETFSLLSKIARKIKSSEIPYFSFRDLSLDGVPCRVGRLGYTGFDGVELLSAVEDATSLWGLLSEYASPAGFGAANYLRLKAGLPLFTHEFRPLVSAADIGLKRVRRQGKLFADCAAQRVSRICFSARSAIDGGVNKKTISNLLWTSEDAFPPERGSIAITSIIPDLMPHEHIGMGYVVYKLKGEPLLHSSNLLRDIRITKKF